MTSVVIADIGKVVKMALRGKKRFLFPLFAFLVLRQVRRRRTL